MAIFPNPNGIGADTVNFSGQRIPPAGNAPDLEAFSFGESVELFNGEDLNG